MSAPSKGQRHDPVVYYALSEYGGVVKIGTTNNLSVRMKNLSRNSVPLRPGATEWGGEPLERSRHIQFSGSRCRGEWFWLTPEVERHIESLPVTSAFLTWEAAHEQQEVGA
jgi:hypothetical protein